MKWRGILFFRFITALVDDDKEMQKFGKSKLCSMSTLNVLNCDCNQQHINMS